MKYTSKQALIDDMTTQYRALWDQIGSIDPTRYEEPGVWGDSWSLKDLVAHLDVWARMCLDWYRRGLSGEDFPIPAEGYTWRRTPELNRRIQRDHRDDAWSDVQARLERAHLELLTLVDNASEEELLTPSVHRWTGSSQLATYIAANSSSHYRAAIRFLKRWKRQQRSKAIDGA